MFTGCNPISGTETMSQSEPRFPNAPATCGGGKPSARRRPLPLAPPRLLMQLRKLMPLALLVSLTATADANEGVSDFASNVASNAFNDAFNDVVSDGSEPPTEQTIVAESTDADELDRRIRNSRWLGISAVIGYGSLQWDYFSREPHTTNEGWFEQDSTEGGADKLGHFHSAHLLTAVLGSWYEDWGATRAEAGKQAAISSLLLMTVMEAGDSFSSFGYSNEDMLIDLLGSYAGYRHYVDDDWQRRVDFRIEHSLKSFDSDISTDYQQMKFLLAVKLDGFDSLQGTPWEWLEFHVGYYARGYDIPGVADTRSAYVGIGLNLGKLFERHGWRRTATVLRYFQPPHTTLHYDHTLDPQ